MNIQYCSDLHLEFPLNRTFLNANPIKPEGDILLMAGDIIPFARIEEAGDFFNFLSDSFEHIYWVPGNHEYYGWDIGTRTGSFQEKIRSNVSLVNNAVIERDGVRKSISTAYLIQRSLRSCLTLLRRQMWIIGSLVTVTRWLKISRLGRRL